MSDLGLLNLRKMGLLLTPGVSRQLVLLVNFVHAAFLKILPSQPRR